MLKDFLKQPETLNQLLFKGGILVLGTLVLLLTLRLVDGDNHRLGTIQIKTATVQNVGDK